MPARFRVHVVFLRASLPNRPERNVGVFLLDSATQRLYFRMREDWQEIADPGDAEVLAEITGDFRKRIDELGDGGGAEFLGSLEEQLSNVLRLTDRQDMEADDLRGTLDRLFEQNCRA